MGNWEIYTDMREIDPSATKKIGAVELPSIHPRKTMNLNYTGAFYVMSSSKNLDAARKFLKFVAQTQYMWSFSRYTHTIPGVKSANKNKVGNSPIAKFVLQILDKYKDSVNRDWIWDKMVHLFHCDKITESPAEGKIHAWDWHFYYLNLYHLLSSHKDEKKLFEELEGYCLEN